MALAFASPAVAQGTVRTLTLEDAVRLAQANGPTIQAARQSLEQARWRGRMFDADLRPQLSMTGTAVDFQRAINPITLPTGETQYIGQAENQSSIGLTLSQRLRRTNGTISVTSLLSRIDVFGNNNSQSWRTQPILVGFSQDLMRRKDLAWDEQSQAFSLEIAERQFVETREAVAVTAVNAFLELYTSEISLRNAIANAQINDTVFNISRLKFDRGTINESELLQSELAVLRARHAADGARLANERAAAQLRRLLAFDPTERIAVVAPPFLANVVVDPEVAVQAALTNGSLADQLALEEMQALQQIDNAKLNNSFSARVDTRVGFNQTGPAFFDAYQRPLGRQSLSFNVGMPLLNWGAGKAEIEIGRAALARARANASNRRAEVAEGARFSALEFLQAQSSMALALKVDSVAIRRFALAKVQYDQGRTMTLTEFLQAQSEKDGAQASLAQSVRSYWGAYYQLRRLTLYDFVAGRPIRD